MEANKSLASTTSPLTSSSASKDFNLFGNRLLTFPAVIWLLVVVGFLIRLHFLNETIYNSDEAYVTIFASKVARFWTLESWHDFPLTGLKTSFGFRNPPLFIYLMAPFFAVTTDPRFAMIGLMIFGSLAIALVGFTVRNMISPKAGILVALMVAFLPNAVHHCRQLWGHDTQIFFTALCFFATERSLRDCRARWFVLAILSAAFAQACHLSGMFLWCLPTFAAFSFPRKKFLRILAGEALIMIFIYLPWLIDETGWTQLEPRPEGNFSNIKLMWSVITGTGNTAPVETPFPVFWGWFGVLTDSFRLDIIGYYYSATYYANPLLTLLMFVFQYGLGILMVWGFVVMALDAKKSQTPMLIWGILATALSPLLTFSLLPISSVPLYQLPAFIPACFAIVYLAERLPDLLQSVTRELLPKQAVRRAFVAALLLLVVGGGSIHAIRTSIVREKADFTQLLPSTFQSKFHAVLLCISVAETLEEIPRTDYTIMQNGKQSDAGLDVWIAAIAFSITQERTIPYNPTANQAFLIVDNETHLREPLELYLKQLDFTPFKTIRVYRLFGQDLKNWKELTVRFSSKNPALQNRLNEEGQVNYTDA